MARVLLGFLAGHIVMNARSVITGELPSLIIPGLEFTPAINILELIFGLALTVVISALLVSRKKGKTNKTKTVLKMLNGALFFRSSFCDFRNKLVPVWNKLGSDFIFRIYKFF